MPETPDWSAPQQATPVFITNQPITASEAGHSNNLVIGGPATNLFLVYFAVSADPTAGAGGVLRDWVVFTVSGSVAGQVGARLAIGPEQPSAWVLLPNGFFAIPTNQTLVVTGTTRQGSGSQQAVFDLGYYLQ